MTVNDSRLWKGTLTFGAVGSENTAEGQITNFLIEQTEGDSEDVVYVLSGESVGGETTAGPWHITGTMIQDFDATGVSLQEWSYRNRDTEQDFTFVPNDVTGAPTVTGTVRVLFLGLGGDVRTRITRDFDWGLVGDPDFGAWDEAVPPAGLTAKATASSGSSSSS